MWDSLKSLNKSPHDRNCFRLLPRVPPGSILEVLAKFRADLRFWWYWCCAAAICAKRRPYAITQNIDGTLNLQYTTSLARSRGGASEQAASMGIKFMPHVVLFVCMYYVYWLIYVNRTRNTKNAAYAHQNQLRFRLFYTTTFLEHKCKDFTFTLSTLKIKKKKN